MLGGLRSRNERFQLGDFPGIQFRIVANDMGLRMRWTNRSVLLPRLPNLEMRFSGWTCVYLFD